MLSTALSAFMRSPHNTNRSMILGDALTTETYVHVRWVWATLPGLIVLSAVTFLVLTMWESSRSEQLLKASVLTGYFYGVDGLSNMKIDPSRHSGRGRRKDDEPALLERSKEIKVRLTRRKDGTLVFSDEMHIDLSEC